MNRGILKRIAKKHGVKVSDVRRDMEIALDETFKNQKMDCFSGELDDGVRPTLEEFIDYATQKVKEGYHKK